MCSNLVRPLLDGLGHSVDTIREQRTQRSQRPDYALWGGGGGAGRDRAASALVEVKRLGVDFDAGAVESPQEQANRYVASALVKDGCLVALTDGVRWRIMERVREGYVRHIDEYDILHGRGHLKKVAKLLSPEALLAIREAPDRAAMRKRPALSDFMDSILDENFERLLTSA